MWDAGTFPGRFVLWRMLQTPLVVSHAHTYRQGIPHPQPQP